MLAADISTIPVSNLRGRHVGGTAITCIFWMLPMTLLQFVDICMMVSALAMRSLNQAEGA